MKRRLIATASVLVCLANAAQAQTLKNIEQFKPGHSATYLVYEMLPDAGKSGEDVVWDFSRLKGKPDTMRQIIAVSNGTKYAATFPKSNIVEQNSDGTYTFIEATATESKVWGIANPQMTMAYDQPYIFLKHPMTLHDSISSDCSRTYDSWGGARGTGTTTMVADGWGTLILPSGTYKALRVKFTQSYTDIPTNGGAPTQTAVTTYAWFDEQHQSGLFKIDKISINSPYFKKDIEKTSVLIAESN